jgi:hypothetical protein
MTRRWGLQAAMTATFVAVTAGAVLLTELVIFGMAALSPPTPLTRDAVQGLVQATAQGLTAKLGNVAGKAGVLRTADLVTGDGAAALGQARPDGDGGVVIPLLTRPDCDLAPASFAVVVSHARTVLASSYPACYPAGSQGSDAQGGVPRKMLSSFVRWPVTDSGQAPLPSGNVVGATVPVVMRAASQQAKGGTAAGPSPGPSAAGGITVPPGAKIFAMLYVQVPAAAPGIGGVTVSPALVRTGLAVLAAAVPVGLAFGLLSTRRLTRRLRHLAALTLQVADGDFLRRARV